MTVRVGKTEEAELRQRAWGESRRRSADRLPEEAKPAERPVALQLELNVASVVQDDPNGPGCDTERHDGLEEADRAGTTPDSNSDGRTDSDDEEGERNPLGY